jgi:hypothetical protein
MKIGWNRTTPKTLDLAFGGALFKQRMVCQPEEYHCKAIVYFSLRGYETRIQKARNPDSKVNPKLYEDFAALFLLYYHIFQSGKFGPQGPVLTMIPRSGHTTCSYCHSNIFNRFWYCAACLNSNGHDYTICMDCFIMGRSCKCFFGYRWGEISSWQELDDNYNKWRSLVQTHSPTIAIPSYISEGNMAEICEEQHDL